MTPEEVNNLIYERLTAFPEMQEIAADPDFKKKIRSITEFAGLDPEYANNIELEVLLALSLHTRISELSQKLADATGLSLQEAEKMETLISALILEPVEEILEVYDVLVEKQEIAAQNTTSEGIPQAQSTAAEGESDIPPTPLTREDVLKALNASRTMDSDVASLKEDAER